MRMYEQDDIISDSDSDGCDSDLKEQCKDSST